MSTDAQTQVVVGSDSPDAGGHDPATLPAGQDAGPGSGGDVEKLRAELNRANREAAERRVAHKQALAELEELRKAQAAAQQAALAEQGKFQELYEAEVKARAELEKQAAALNDRIRAQELAALRQRVANEKGVPAALAERLIGDTEEEIAADAEKLVAAMPRPGAPSLNGGERGAGKGLSTAEARMIAGRLGVDPRYLE